ncbi:hypothetical protein BZG36_04406 [Bifiguratus adelaidae]|uniref:Uncharacterized protein n=1 Tax=Bifiguratus adelaidae TaxID=1938954 RepID=A0A261XW98_9FUNG|nr:hypothetical protein BZG36_04406 [Bifiguratus adelaidae]
MRVSILALLVAACSLQVEAKSVKLSGLQVEVDNYEARAKVAPINEITVRDHGKREFHPVDLTTKASAGIEHLKPAHYSPPRDDPKAAAPHMSEPPFLTPPGDNLIDSINITVIPAKHLHSHNGSSGESPAQSAIINNNNKDAANINHRLSQTGKEAQHVAQTIDDELSSAGELSKVMEDTKDATGSYGIQKRQIYHDTTPPSNDEFPAPGFYRLSGIKRSESENPHDLILRPRGASSYALWLSFQARRGAAYGGLAKAGAKDPCNHGDGAGGYEWHANGCVCFSHVFFVRKHLPVSMPKVVCL